MSVSAGERAGAWKVSTKSTAQACSCETDRREHVKHISEDRNVSGGCRAMGQASHSSTEMWCAFLPHLSPRHDRPLPFLLLLLLLLLVPPSRSPSLFLPPPPSKHTTCAEAYPPSRWTTHTHRRGCSLKPTLLNESWTPGASNATGALTQPAHLHRNKKLHTSTRLSRISFAL